MAVTVLPPCECQCQGCVRQAKVPGELVGLAMEMNGFPADLMPQGAIEHCFGDETGPFSIEMREDIEKVVDEYQVKYMSRISGVLEKGFIRNLKGVQVRNMMTWFNIDTIQAGASCKGRVYFYVGLAYRSIAEETFKGMWNL
eukprot:TRINITY_DN51981_c0_g1_i1.p2 TRINITY_DN51981_c0_g1~~TRINITY_DN51981_c0_g1_i1.p2  ORF type:complete len:142 (+),score=10.25 TRINITY_DN51981_c0_g1_i1:143-568(+)